MSESTLLRDLLLPELETEVGKTRPLFEALPDGGFYECIRTAYLPDRTGQDAGY